MKKSKKINSNLFRDSALKFILGGIAIFAFGIFVGYQLDNSAITKIQGFLFNAVGDASATDTNATDANATDSNATDSNATDSNATDSNATDSNATSGNAQATDNILYLQTFELGASSATAGDKVNVTLGTSGACNSGASIVFKNNSNGTTFTASVSSIGNNPYITIPNNVSAGSYSVVEVMLVGTNSNNSTFSRRWSAVDQNADYFVDFIKKSITITAKETPNTGGNTQQQKKLALNSISLKTTETNVSEKVYVDFKTTKTISSMKLTFNSSNDETMVVYVKSLTNNPYFEVPSTTIIGDYSLVSATISSTDSTIIYSKDGSVSGSERFDFNSTIKVNDVKQQDTFVYNNEDLTNEIITDLYNAKSTATINVSADTNPIISEELFNAIKGTNKKLVITYNDNQLVFNGKDISNSKSIDVSITASAIQSDTSIGKLVSDGIVLDFASNGDLPGDATVRIKITEEMKSKLGTGKVYVYYYNTQCDDFTEIATEVKPTSDGYYEFNMNHNSEYILVNEKLDDSLLSDGEENIVNFQKSDKVNLLLIGLGVLLVIVVIVIIIIVKKKSKKETPQVMNDINNNNNNFN